jgi:S1-C subfamily serine protease
VEGSGWVAAPDLVVTNAHVVAGENDTAVQIGGVGPGLSARAIVFDPRNDIAILSVPGLSVPRLSTAAGAAPGTSAAILGYPLDGAFDAEPGRVGQTETVDTQNAYGQDHVLRSITALRGLVRPGNSGGPLVDAHGRVVATVFAALTGTSRVGGFAVPDAVVRQELAKVRPGAAPVGTGACAN